MGITITAAGAFRETGASFFFVPKGALTHHLRSRRWYPSLRSGRALFTKQPQDASPEGQTMPQRFPAVIVCAAGRRLSPHLHLRCKSLSLPWDNLPPACDKPATGSFVAEMDDAIPHRPFSFACAKRNKTAPCRGQKGRERLWRSIIWKQRS